MQVVIPDALKARYASLPTKEGRLTMYSVCPLCGYPTWSFERDRRPDDATGVELQMDTQAVCAHCETFAYRFPDVACYVRQVLVFFAELHGLR